MLYVTTRDARDAYTANRALSEDRCPAGGFFVPMRLPHYDEAQIAALADNSFSQNMAQVLNLFFGTQLDGWDVEFGIGRYAVQTASLNGKITVAELWHNPVYRFERMAMGVEKAIRRSDKIGKAPTDWLQIATRVAALFGIFGQLLQNGEVSIKQGMDVAVPGGNLSALMAVWYARKMGLPVVTAVCCCNENAGIWNLLHKGELRTDAPVISTFTPDCDVAVPADLERLIFAVLGREETLRFASLCVNGGVYAPEPEQRLRLREGIHVSVVSDRKTASTIPNLHKTTNFVADPYTALAYSGLVDYRAATGESRPALILMDESPVHSRQFVARCMDITTAELKTILE